MSGVCGARSQTGLTHRLYSQILKAATHNPRGGGAATSSSSSSSTTTTTTTTTTSTSTSTININTQGKSAWRLPCRAWHCIMAQTESICSPGFWGCSQHTAALTPASKWQFWSLKPTWHTCSAEDVSQWNQRSCPGGLRTGAAYPCGRHLVHVRQLDLSGGLCHKRVGRF